MKKILLFGMVIAAALILVRQFSNKSTVNDLQEAATHEEEIERESGESERESGADKQMSSWWWSRAYPDPEYINEKFYNGWLHAREMKNPRFHYQANGPENSNNTNVFSGNWRAIGPDQNIGGRILSIAIDPQNGNNIFIGSASGGIWKSTTGGVGAIAWKPVRTGFPVLGVASIIINPVNPKIIYAGTGEVYRSDTSNIGFNVWKARGTYGVGILKSIDGGTSWAQILNRRLSNLFGIQML
jgi:hypothetical protein